ncbi:MAG: glycosyltransferase family 2 protein [Candidatus Eremiobacteraeota bacterium]|nr:glycosyltransferase family 2 protein [Candidatus Eremiobacteraeota bacterium]
MDLPAFSVVVPTFNEEAGIGAVLGRLLAHVALLRARYAIDVVVVDDGSGDRTLEALHKFSADSDAGLTIVAHERNAGLVAAMRTGAAAAKSDTVVFLDADLSYSPEILEPLVLARNRGSAAAALASPYMRGGRVANVPFVRLAASVGANWILTRCARGRLHTFTGMVRAYDRAAFLAIGERAYVGEFNAWAVAALVADGKPVVEIPAALIWPVERYASPSRMTVRDFWTRLVLVAESARVINDAFSRERPQVGTLVLSGRTSSPFSPKPR